jgi:hypothetical protein
VKINCVNCSRHTRAFYESVKRKLVTLMFHKSLVARAKYPPPPPYKRRMKSFLIIVVDIVLLEKVFSRRLPCHSFNYYLNSNFSSSYSIYIVTCIPIARQRLGKRIPGTTNASIARRRLIKHSFATAEEAVHSVWCASRILTRDTCFLQVRACLYKTASFKEQQRLEN